MKAIYLGLLLCMLVGSPVSAQAQNWLDVGAKLVKGVSATSMTEADEINIGDDLSARVIGVYPLVKDEAAQRRLNRVGLWVALQSDRPELPWRFGLVQSDTVNAIAAPGGVVLLTTGMLSLIRDEAELACVLGHEIGHITRKHHLTALRNGLLKDAFLDAAAAAASQRSGGSGVGQFIKERGREIAVEAVSLSLGRSEESEADLDGVVLAAKAGYDPAACLSFMQRLAETTAETSAFEDLLKTHPAAGGRVKDIESTLTRLNAGGTIGGSRPPMPINLRSNGNGKR